MATLGDTSEPTSSAEAWDSTENNFAMLLAMPSGGPWLVTHVAVWAAGYGSNCLATNVLWSAGGSVLNQSAEYTMTQRTFSASGSDLHNKALGGGGEVVSGGINVYVGFSIPATDAVFFGRRATGSHFEDDDVYVANIAGGSNHAVGAMGAYITYQLANSLPTAPTWVSPADGTVLTDLTPNLVFNHNDVDGDACASYDIEVDTTSGNGVVPDWASLFQSVTNGTGGIVGNQITFTLNTLSRGQWYAARVRTADAVGDGAWSSVRYFKGNSLPTITGRVPA